MSGYVVIKIKYVGGWRTAVVEDKMAADWAAVQATRDTDIHPRERDKPQDMEIVGRMDSKEQAHKEYDIWNGEVDE